MLKTDWLTGQKLLDVTGLAEVLGLPRERVDRWVRDGQVDSPNRRYGRGSRLYYCEADVARIRASLGQADVGEVTPTVDNLVDAVRVVQDAAATLETPWAAKFGTVAERLETLIGEHNEATDIMGDGDD